MPQHGSQYKVSEQTRGDLAPKHGIVSARLEVLADVLNTRPSALLDAVKKTDIEPLMDTADDKGRSRNAETRPESPGLRCLAFTVEDFRRLAAAVGAEEALEEDDVPA